MALIPIIIFMSKKAIPYSQEHGIIEIYFDFL